MPEITRTGGTDTHRTHIEGDSEHGNERVCSCGTRWSAEAGMPEACPERPAPASDPPQGYQPCNHECNGCPTCDPGLAPASVETERDRLRAALEEINRRCAHLSSGTPPAGVLAIVRAALVTAPVQAGTGAEDEEGDRS